MPPVVLSILLFLILAGPPPQENRLSTLLKNVERTANSMRAARWLWQLREQEDLADTEGRSKILHTLRRLSAQKTAPLALRRLAARSLALRLLLRGDDRRARQIYDDLGMIRDWWLIGPFDNEGHQGYSAVYGPEKKVDLQADESGTQRQVRWRRPPDEWQRPDGLIKLHPLFSPRSSAAAYAFTILAVERPTRVLLHLGSDDGCKLWINRGLVVEDPGSHPLRAEQHVVALTLPAGNNRVLIKVVQEEGSWEFSLAVTDPRGRLIPSLEVVSDRAAVEKALADDPPPPPKKVEPRTTLNSWFLEQAYKNPQDPEILAEAAMALAYTGAEDRRKRRVEELVQQAVRHLDPAHKAGVAIRLLLARATEDDNLARQLLHQARRLDPARPEAQSRLGFIHHIRNQTEKALRFHRMALQADPAYLPSQLEIAELLHGLGLHAQMEKRLAALIESHPQAPEVLATAANLYRRSGRLRKVVQLNQRLLKLRPNDQLVLRSQFEIAVEQGRQGWWIERGDLLLHNHRIAEALDSYRRAVAICPQEPLAIVREGLALQAQGRVSQALARWRRALELAPGDRGLEKHIESLEPQRQAFYHPWKVDPQTLRQAPGPGAQPDDSEAGALRLFDLTVVRLQKKATTSRYRQQVIRIINPRGAELNRTFHIEYAPARQQVRILQSRVFHPDNTTDASVLVRDYSLSEPWYNLYYDVHDREITFPELAPGDLVELSYLIEDTGGRNMLGNYFGDMTLLQYSQPTQKAVYVLLAPEKQVLHFNRPKAARYRKIPQEDKTVAHLWEAQDLEAVEPEPDMPGITETNSYLHVSTFESFRALGRWYAGQVSDQLVPGPQVKKLARELTEGLTEELEKIRAIHRFVTDQTRYVGLEFGIHSYVPYQVSDVLMRKFGDCKDKSALLVTLFGQVGIRAQMALVRMKRLGPVPRDPASLAVFNHAICHLPDFDLWLDGTAPFHDVTELPDQDQGTLALVIEEDGGRLVPIPTSQAERNRTDIRYRVQPAQDGSAAIHSRVAVTGSVAPALRARFAGAAARRDVFEKIMNELFPGAKVTSMDIENLKEPQHPLVTRAEFRAPAVCRVEEGTIEVPALVSPTKYQKIFSPFQERRFDLLLSPPWSVEWTVQVAVPKGFQLVNLPGADTVESAFGLARISFERKGEEILVRASFRLNQNRIQAADYPAFRRFLGEVDGVLGSRLTFTGDHRAGM
jgi:tetratricopeptide (TPR) repeat protein/transglutaminase-like putative cysteine protease